MKVIKKYKELFIIGGLLLILLIIMGLIFGRMFVKKSASTYGNRLKGISSVSSKDNKKVSDKLEEYDEVDKVEIRIQGKIIYLHINYKKGTSIYRAKEIANFVPSLYSDKIIKDYDLGLFLIENADDDKETKEFLVAGTKHPDMESISYTKS